MQYRRQQYQIRYFREWQKTSDITATGRPFDALIQPILTEPAWKFGNDFPYSYTVLAPILDLSSAAFPVPLVEGQDELPDWEPSGSDERLCQQLKQYGESLKIDTPRTVVT
jgi:amidase